jgi:ABC-type uncharacterized transport system YnjBCD permease subunit
MCRHYVIGYVLAQKLCYRHVLADTLCYRAVACADIILWGCCLRKIFFIGMFLCIHYVIGHVHEHELCYRACAYIML